MRAETTVIHGGYEGALPNGAVSAPIFQTAAFEFESADHAAALFNLEVEGYRYSRISNPSVAALERRLAELECGSQAVVTASGQAALEYAVLNLSRPGANLVSSPLLYGTTHTLFAHHLPSLGINVRFAKTGEAEDLADLVDDQTCAVFCESIANPSGFVADLERIAELAHGLGVPLIVDNTLASPMLIRPIEYGADIVVHSLTKFIGGHGSTLGGVVIDSGNFDWRRHATRFPMFNRPDPAYHGLVYTHAFGRNAFAARCRSALLRVTGAVLSPISAYLLTQGLETLAVRIDRHVTNAHAVAHFLRNDARIAWVDYAGFADNPNHRRVAFYAAGRASSVFTFGVKGGIEVAKALYDNLTLIKRVVNFGDVRSLACHPASTTHRQMTPAQQNAAGISTDLIRISIGIEHVNDIITDLEQALTGAFTNRPVEDAVP